MKRILATGIVPVVRAPSPMTRSPWSTAIRAGGIDIIELTMTVRGRPS